MRTLGPSADVRVCVRVRVFRDRIETYRDPTVAFKFIMLMKLIRVLVKSLAKPRLQLKKFKLFNEQLMIPIKLYKIINITIMLAILYLFLVPHLEKWLEL